MRIKLLSYICMVFLSECIKRFYYYDTLEINDWGIACRGVDWLRADNELERWGSGGNGSNDPADRRGGGGYGDASDTKF